MSKQILIKFAAIAALSVISGASLHATLVDTTEGGKTATQSTNYDNSNYLAPAGIDNNFTNFTHTASADTNATWIVDLGASMPVDNATLYNRGDGCCQNRFRDLNVNVLDYNHNPVGSPIILNAGNTLNGPASITTAVNKVGRYLSVSRTPTTGGGADDNNVLSLGEVEVHADNVALGKPASQSSTLADIYSASNATDGNLGNFSHTQSGDSNPTLTIDLQGTYSLDSLILHNRDDCCGGRLRDITVQLLDANQQAIFTQSGINPGNGGQVDYQVGPAFLGVDFLAANGGNAVNANFIRISRTPNTDGGDNGSVLSLGEVQAFGTAVPEPTSLSLLGLGAIGALSRRRRSNKF